MHNLWSNILYKIPSKKQKIEIMAKKVNKFMRMKNQAVKQGSSFFTYRGKDGKQNTYVRTKTKTGMVTFKKKK